MKTIRAAIVEYVGNEKGLRNIPVDRVEECSRRVEAAIDLWVQIGKEPRTTAAQGKKELAKLSKAFDALSPSSMRRWKTIHVLSSKELLTPEEYSKPAYIEDLIRLRDSLRTAVNTKLTMVSAGHPKNFRDHGLARHLADSFKFMTGKAAKPGSDPYKGGKKTGPFFRFVLAILSATRLAISPTTLVENATRRR